MELNEILTIQICESAGVMPISIDRSKILLAAMNPLYEEVAKIKSKLEESYSSVVEIQQTTPQEWDQWFHDGHPYPKPLQKEYLQSSAPISQPNIELETKNTEINSNNESPLFSVSSLFNPRKEEQSLPALEISQEATVDSIQETKKAGSLGLDDVTEKYDFFELDDEDEFEESYEQENTDIEDTNDPVISAVASILLSCDRLKASDIHIETLEERMRIRYRIDGVLSEIYSLPKNRSRAIISRVKVMSKLDIAERRLPQDGRLRCIVSNLNLDFRVSTLPGKWGEKIVLRSLQSDSSILKLDKLVTFPSELSLVRSMGNSPYGIFIVVGPTGSGKSTTLYSILNERNTPEVNISTVEDPVEYTLDGIHQVQVLREKGLDFSRALRSLMRQDPDIILVGETRDKETAQTAMEAALTGHMVFTTLHANDTATAITRLSEMGIPQYLVGSSLIGVMAQRLVRKVCSKCSFERRVSEPRDHLAINYGITHLRMAKVEEIKDNLENKNLCPECSGTGYKGRLGLYEVMKVNESIRELIINSSTADLIRECATKQGMKSLLDYGLELVKRQLTTLEEVQRVCLLEDSKND